MTDEERDECRRVFDAMVLLTQCASDCGECVRCKAREILVGTDSYRRGPRDIYEETSDDAVNMTLEAP